MSNKTAKSQKNVSAAAVMPKPENQNIAPVAAPEVDPLERDVPAEMLEVYYELCRWVGDGNDNVLRVTYCEDFGIRALVRVLRSGGWMEKFLWEVICRESRACEFKDKPHLSPNQVRQILADKSREAEAA